MSFDLMPKDLSPDAAAFWTRIVDDYELEPADFVKLSAAVRTMTHIENLEESVTADGFVVHGSKGQPRVHPAIPVLTGLYGLLSRQLRDLALDEDEGGDSVGSQNAREAANERWRMAREKRRAA